MHEETKEMWALVELFGHQRIAGKVSEAELGGGALIRIDVPAIGDRDAITKYYSVKAIYGITPVTEATALRMAQTIDAAPVNAYSIERLINETLKNRTERAISHSSNEDDDDDEVDE